MYDYDVISEESFLSWEKNDDPAELEGKGVALKSCNQFFTWLHQAETVDDESWSELTFLLSCMAT